MIKRQQLKPALWFSAGALTYTLTFPSFAQNTDTETDATAVDETIVVTATQNQRPWHSTPASVTNVATAAQLPGLRIDAAELLAGIAGLQSDSRANYAQDSRLVMRGFGARSAFGVRGVLLNLDGIPLSMPDGQAQTSSILLDEPDNVEVLRGPLAALYGNGAGGVIEWRSKVPQQSALKLELMAGADDTQRYFTQGTFVSDDARHALQLSAARLTTDGPRAHNSAERDQFALRWYYQATAATRMVLRVDDNNAPLLQDPGALTPADWRADDTQTFGGATTFNTRKMIHHQQASVSFINESSQPWTVNAWAGSREVVQFLPFPGDDATSSGAVIDLTRNFSGLNARYTHPLTDRVDLLVGADLERQKDTRLGFVNDFGERGDLRRDEIGRVETFDTYALLDWQPHEDWRIVTGARYSDLAFSVDDFYQTEASPDDSGSRDDAELAWSFSANYEVSEALTAFAAYGRSFAAPTLTEMAYRNQGSGLNTQLAPSINMQSELGLKWLIPTALGATQVDASLFRIDSKDTLLVDQSNDGRTTYRNAGDTERYGAELNATGALSEQLDYRFAAHWIDAHFGDSQPAAVAGRRIPGIAEYSAYWQLNWQLPLARHAAPQLSWVVDYRSDIAATDNNDVIAPARTLHHLALQSEHLLGQWQVKPWLRWNNVTDKKYVGSVVVNQGSGRAFEPAPGRNISAGISIGYAW